jgi:large subunit ribosomal protein L5
MAKEKKTKKGDEAQKQDKKKGRKVDEKYAVIPAGYTSRMLTKYREEIVPAMQKKFNYKSPMQVPRLVKIVVNMGVGEASRNVKLLDDAAVELGLITGQKARINRARVSVAQFKVRQGMPVGASVTLRGRRMYDFLDRLVNVAIPRVRDFRGLPTNAFDGRGNHSMGIREQLIFTEINYSDVENTQGMDITTVTTAKTDAECRELLTLLGMPFRKK